MKNKIVWIFLILFTLLTFFISEKNFALIAILIIAVLKLLMVAFQFMELKKAHFFWRITFSLLIMIVTLTLYLLRN
ncbi:MAG: cytochrome C oxidase subunit IV family protein [Saprospirales bacterium]|nr:cytochrome C oxidase subunit IV family protein [Saprospirales bacterium]MBK8352626.1 cytochrome C oxidase subunit IV family protein [Saprospirales bacterium]